VAGVGEQKPPPQVFTREATGLVREWSPKDMFIYSWLGGPGIWSPILIFVLVYGTYAFPGGNIPLAAILTVIMCIPLYLAYSFLGAALPRTGGDYIFNTRILPSALGVAVMFPVMVYLQQFNYFNAYAIATLGLAPLGQLYGNVGFANWISVYPGVLILAIVLILIAGVIMARGMRFYAIFQRVFFIITIISVVTFIAILVGSTQTQFAQAFNSFEGSALGHSDAYNYVISSANQAGYSSPTGSNFWSTLGLTPFIAGTIIFAIQGIINIGEVKKASSVKYVTASVAGGGIAAGLMVAILFFVIVNAFGQNFIGALSYHFNNGTPVATAFGSPPFFTFLAGLVASSPILVYIMSIGVIAGVFLFFPGIYIYGTRYLFAMSFDRVLPSSFSNVNEKTHAPIVAIGLMAAAQIIWSLLFSFTSIGVFVSSVIFVTLTGMTLTCISAIVFPYLKRTKPTYDASSLVRFKIGSLPAIVLVGILGLVTLAIFFYDFATVPALGANNPTSIVVMIASFVIGAILYYAVKAYRRGKGINLEWVYKEIPPE
jgi:amino acid transporter